VTQNSATPGTTLCFGRIAIESPHCDSGTMRRIGINDVKHTAVLTLVLFAISYPVVAKAHYSHRHVARHAQHYDAGNPHSDVTCEMVRTYIAQVGSAQALAMAQSAGMTASEKERAKRCVAKKI
jgi:hypothetical protein